MDNRKSNFMNSIKIESDSQKELFLKIQKEIEKDISKERVIQLTQELSEEQKKKLIQLYKEQIGEIKCSTEYYKQKIIKIRSKLSNN